MLGCDRIFTRNLKKRITKMKKIIAVVLTVIIALALIFGGRIYDSFGSTYDKIYDQLIEEIPSGRHYSKSQIALEITAYEEAFGLKGNVLSIANFSTLDYYGESFVELYIYVYEFELEEDAVYWYGEMLDDGWKFVQVKDNVVIYGSNSFINDIKL